MEPTIEEITKLKLNPERGFYVDMHDGNIYAGQEGDQWNEKQVRKIQAGY